MTQDYPKPIAPPPELVQQWGHDANLSGVPHNDEHWAYEQHIATHAAQWGADQELEACWEWLNARIGGIYPDELRTARRPKPPSLKELALQALSEAVKMADDTPPEGICSDQANIIRRALEQLDD